MILGMTSIICFTIIIVVALFIVNPDEFSIFRNKKKKDSEKTFHIKFQKKNKKSSKSKKAKKSNKKKKED